MKTLNLVQGSDEWLEIRKAHFCASDCAAMMGASPHKSRNQLLYEKKTGNAKPVDSFLQSIFDKGHAAEDAARDILEINLLESFPAIVGLREIQGLSLLASFDGLNGIVFEHKLFNVTLAENVKNKVLDPAYYWQLEQQLLVSGVGEALFVCSDGTPEQWEEMFYQSVPERREQLISGWLQFDKDLDAYVVEAKQEAIIATTAETFPLVKYEIVGSVVTSNIKSMLPAIRDRAEIEQNRTLETDQDFADKENFIKAVKKAREQLKTISSEVTGEYVSLSEFQTLVADYDAILQPLQSSGEKQVKTEKERIKNDVVSIANDNLTKYYIECEAKISPLSLIRIGVPVAVDLLSAMKNKRNLESLKSSVDDAVAKQKIEIDKAMARILPNHIYLKEHAKDYAFLFNDASQIINQETEPFQAVVKARIAFHEKELERKAELERERIRAEERLKLEREAEAERLRLIAEQKVKESVPVPEPIKTETPPPVDEVKTLAEETTEPEPNSGPDTTGDDQQSQIEKEAIASFMIELDLGRKESELLVKVIAQGRITHVKIAS